MTDDRTLPEDFPVLAGEYALGIIEGPDRVRALGLTRTDARFREAVERWRGQLASLLDEIEPVTPPAELWARIKAATHTGDPPDNVHRLHRKVAVWRGLAGVMTALAASLALFMLMRPPLPVPAPAAPVAPAPTPPPAPVPAPASAPMLARIVAGKEVALIASWDEQRSQLLLARVADMPVVKARSHELWVIPASGKPQSLGVMPESGQGLMTLPESRGRLMLDGATLAISVEPRGGSPTGAPTGPVVASGPLKAA